MRSSASSIPSSPPIGLAARAPLRDPHLSPEHRLLYLVLAVHASQGDRHCWFKQENLAAKVGRHRGSVNKWVGALVDAGWLRTHKPSPRSPLDYRLQDAHLLNADFGVVASHIVLDPTLSAGPKVLYGLLTTFCSTAITDRWVGRTHDELAAMLSVSGDTAKGWMRDLKSTGYVTATAQRAMDVWGVGAGRRQVGNRYELMDRGFLAVAACHPVVTSSSPVTTGE